MTMPILHSIYSISNDNSYEDNDNIIIKIFYGNGNKLNSNFFTKSWMDIHPELFQYLQDRFDDSDSVYETLYRIKIIYIRVLLAWCVATE